MPIENRNLTKGTKLTGRYHKQTFSCEVVEDAEGKLRYHLEDGREFKSPSAAGMAITGHSCDGWKFWSVVTEENAAAPKAENQEAVPAAETESNCRACGSQDRPQENRGVSGAQSERGAGGSNPVVLPGLRQELHCLGSRSTGGLPQPASSQLKLLEKGINTRLQAPLIGSLPCSVIIPPSLLPKVMIGNRSECAGGNQW